MVDCVIMQVANVATGLGGPHGLIAPTMPAAELLGPLAGMMTPMGGGGFMWMFTGGPQGVNAAQLYSEALKQANPGLQVYILVTPSNS